MFAVSLDAKRLELLRELLPRAEAIAWGAIAVSLHERGKRQEAAALLDHSLPTLFAQIPMHDRARAADSTMGA
jgi:hypothetical protein